MPSPIQITAEDIFVDEAGTVPAKLLHFEGQLDESNVDIQAKAIYDVLDSIAVGTYLMFDLEGLSYLNSKSIGYLTDWHMKLQKKGSGVLIVRARENILDILGVVGLTQIISAFPTLDEAKAFAFKNNPEKRGLLSKLGLA